MNSTRKKDDNGFEIFEGDTIKYSGDGCGKDNITVVKWDDDLCGFTPFCEQILSAADTYSEWHITSVVIVKKGENNN